MVMSFMVIFGKIKFMLYKHLWVDCSWISLQKDIKAKWFNQHQSDGYFLGCIIKNKTTIWSVFLTMVNFRDLYVCVLIFSHLWPFTSRCQQSNTPCNHRDLFGPCNSGKQQTRQGSLHIYPTSPPCCHSVSALSGTSPCLSIHLCVCHWALDCVCILWFWKLSLGDKHHSATVIMWI